MIHVYNINTETHTGDKNNYLIHRPHILGNPYTHIDDRKTLATYVVKTREEALFLVKKLKKEKQMKTKREVKIHQPTYTRYDEDEDEAERQEVLRQFEKLRNSEQ